MFLPSRAEELIDPGGGDIRGSYKRSSCSQMEKLNQIMDGSSESCGCVCVSTLSRDKEIMLKEVCFKRETPVSPIFIP